MSGTIQNEIEKFSTWCIDNRIPMTDDYSREKAVEKYQLWKKERSGKFTVDFKDESAGSTKRLENNILSGQCLKTESGYAATSADGASKFRPKEGEGKMETLKVKKAGGTVTQGEVDAKVELVSRELGKYCDTASAQFDRAYLAIHQICQENPTVDVESLKSVLESYKDDIGALYFAHMENKGGELEISKRSYDKESLKAADREIYGPDFNRGE